jgi:hypothetical protein
MSAQVGCVGTALEAVDFFAAGLVVFLADIVAIYAMRYVLRMS